MLYFAKLKTQQQTHRQIAAIQILIIRVVFVDFIISLREIQTVFIKYLKLPFVFVIRITAEYK